jgi:hypothetical protein
MTKSSLSEVELEEVLSEVTHDLRNIVSTCRAEAQLALIKYERSGNVERMVTALNGVIHQTDLMIRVLEEKLEPCRNRELVTSKRPLPQDR